MDDYRQSDEYCRYFVQKGWQVDEVGDTRVLVKKVPLIGSVIKVHRGSPNITVTQLDEVAKKHKALFVVVEPNIVTEDPGYAPLEQALTYSGFRDLNMFLSPTKTMYIDLTPSEEIILSKFDEDIRKGLRRNFVKNITFKDDVSIEEFHKLLNTAGDKLNIFIQSFPDWKQKWEAFGTNLKIIHAYLDGNLLGGNMLILKPPMAFGLFLPVTTFGREMRISASLIWEGLKLAKKNGCTTFDLNGLYDERYKSPKRWLGLTEFKRKFKGHEVEFMHPSVKVYAKWVMPFQKLGLLWILLGDVS